jgi:hypothetical protein
LALSFTFGCQGPNTVSGPDGAAWSLSVNVALEDVGAYSVCFREAASGTYATIPSTSGARALSILPLGADTTASRGVFYTQRFSAAASASYDQAFTVAGRMLVPSKAKKVALSDSTSCDPSVAKFVSAVAPVSYSADTTAPTVVSICDEMYDTVDTSLTGPGLSDLQVPPPAYITVDFTEPVTVDGCLGNVTIMKLVSSSEVQVIGGIDCSTGVADGLKVRFKNTAAMENDAIANSAPPSGSYFFELEYGAVLDLAGNPLARTSFATESERVYQGTTSPRSYLKMGTTTFDEGYGQKPVLVFSKPRNGGAIAVDLDQVPYSLTMTLGFNTDVFYDSTKTLVVKDCGDTLVCDAVTDDGESPTGITVGGSSVESATGYGYGYGYGSGYGKSYGSDVTFDLPPAAAAVALGTEGASKLRRFVLEVAEGAFAQVSGDGSDPPVASATALSDAMTIEFLVDATGFSAASAITVNSGTSTSEGLTFSARVGAVDSGQYSVCYCDDLVDATLEDFGDGEMTYSIVDDQLLTDLATLDTMTGTGAFAGFDSVAAHVCTTKCAAGCVGPNCYCEGMSAGLTALCLPKGLCMEACDLVGASCAAVSVHSSQPLCLIGKSSGATVLREEWDTLVSKPGTACTHASDFQTYAGLYSVTDRVDVDVDYVVEPEKATSIEVTSVPGGLTSGLLSTDRIMVIDNYGACGLSAAAKAVELPGNTTWGSFYPRSLFFDAPAEDKEDPNKAVPGIQYLDYTTVPASYCAEENLDLHAYTIPLSGLMKSAAVHACSTKCAAECEEKDPALCYCEGYLSGFDTETSNAVCADVHLCEYICNNIEDCTSIDMHASLPRCFLNTGCATQKVSAEYGIRTKAPAARRAKDLGYSHGQLLRFEPLTFSTGGTFKLCFCDSALLAAGATCGAAADFSVQVGTIHSSGVSCLLREPKLQKVDCVEQFHGGMRCYGSQPVPSIDVYELAESTFAAQTPAPTPADITTYCLMIPQEVRAADTACQHAGIA